MTLIQIAYALRQRVLAATGWPTRGVKVALFNAAGEVLLVRNGYGETGAFVLPGGGVGWRESPDRAARREVMEEAGCRIERLRFVAVYESREEGRRDTIHLFVGRTSDEPRVDGWEVVEARFFAPGALPPTTSCATRRRLAEVASGGPYPSTW